MFIRNLSLLLCVVLLPSFSWSSENCKPSFARIGMSYAADQFVKLRYDVKVEGVEAVKAKGNQGILFLANHSAGVDAVMTLAALSKDFVVRPVQNSGWAAKPGLKQAGKILKVVKIPGFQSQDPTSTLELENALREIEIGLSKGENFLIFPSGRGQESRLESLIGTSGVERILERSPNARVVMVRNQGLWGSHLSRAYDTPYVGDTPTKQTAKTLLAAIFKSGVFFMPKRPVNLKFYEPQKFPKTGGRQLINRTIEDFMNGVTDNHPAPHATYFPLTPWEPQMVRELPDPRRRNIAGDLSKVDTETQQKVDRILKDEFKLEKFETQTTLGDELGLDSVSKLDLILHMEKEFGEAIHNPDVVRTVGDLYLIASGQAKNSEVPDLKPVPKKWANDKKPSTPIQINPNAKTIPEAFLAQAKLTPNKIVLVDEVSGPLTYSDIVTRIFLLKPIFEKLEGTNVGVMLPASAGAAVVTLALQFANKVPTMINFTMGESNMAHAAEAANLKTILSSKTFTSQLEGRGVTFDSVGDKLRMLDEIGKSITFKDKLLAKVNSLLSWNSLRKAPIQNESVILFTSGSEAAPKGVPLTHENQLTNLRGAEEYLNLFSTDRFLSFLPPFHSFGNTVGTILPLIAGIPTVFSPNPNASQVLAKLMEMYKPTLMVGTPTFLNGVVQSGTAKQLASLRMVVTGAAKLEEDVRSAAEAKIPNIELLEGYGITECSPVICVVPSGATTKGTVGKVVKGLEYRIVDLDTQENIPAGSGRSGRLIVKGKSVFSGYLDPSKNPFIVHENEKWYDTGDIMQEDAENFLFFKGRLKRFVKRGGEMISLPAIESALTKKYPSTDAGPTTAIEAIDSANPEIVLFTTTPITLAEANQALIQGGLTNLSKINRVIKVETIPMLGTGKIDYRTLKQMLVEP